MTSKHSMHPCSCSRSINGRTWTATQTDSESATPGVAGLTSVAMVINYVCDRSLYF